MEIPEHKLHTLNNIVADLKQIENIVALVLGGSYCTGAATVESDLDIGIYYYEHKPFDTNLIKAVAQRYETGDAATVTDFYGWGPWVNGGAWINTASGEVDFVYRNIEQVQTTIYKAGHGIWENDFEQQPPFGFSSLIYLAETYYCQPLYDPHNILQELKTSVKQYPPELKKNIVQQSLWQAEFALWQADKFAAKNNIYNFSGCLTRIIKNIVEALFALNETYSIGDKNAAEKIMQMEKRPDHFKQQVENILSINKENLPGNAGQMRVLFQQVILMSEEMYRPYFNL